MRRAEDAPCIGVYLARDIYPYNYIYHIAGGEYFVDEPEDTTFLPTQCFCLHTNV